MHLARRQRIERGGIDQHQRRLVERADQVLARWRIDRGLAADRTVHLRQQRRRHLHETAAALHDRGGEPHQIADHPAAERDDMVAALDAQREQPIDQPGEAVPALGALARGQHDRLDRHAGEPRRQPRHQRRFDIGVGHHHQPLAARQRRQMLGRPLQQPALDQDRIAVRAQPHLDPLHRSSASMIASTVAPCGSGWLRTWIGASA